MDNKTSVNILQMEENALNQEIMRNSILYFFRSTPFTEHGEFNYNGALKPDFFFKHLFSEKGNCEEYTEKIIKEINEKHKKSIILIGNQGCGKTTFIHNLKRSLKKECVFKILDFDKNTSNPNLEEYIEIFSSYLHNKMYSDYCRNNSINKAFYNLYECNKQLIIRKINGKNNVRNIFEKFHKTFIDMDFSQISPEDFINDLDNLFFNQILCLVVLWHIAEFRIKNNIEKMVFCLDNLDVLVNSEIISGFFDEYFLFARNIDSIIQHIDSPMIKDMRLEYNKIFTFVFSCRQHTWAKVKRSYLHQGNIISLSSFEKDITDAFDKNEILEKRTDYIDRYFDDDFSKNVINVKSLLEDLKEWHNIYDLFNDDYRQCSITFEKILEENTDLLENYISLRKGLTHQGFYGARGLIFKTLFDKFRDEDLFKSIGVLDVSTKEPPVSNARIILNYLDYHTFSKGKKKSVTFEKIIHDFDGIVDEKQIEYSLLQMFKLGVNESLWNELIAFIQIDTDELDECKGKKIFITKAGHEYLDLIATHFEFFNTRVCVKRTTDISLFSNLSICEYIGHKKYIYNFEETIQNVIDVFEGCCKKMSEFYSNIMFNRFGGKENYLESEFVYGQGKSKVFHGERIIHTHIRYIDHFRLYILGNREHNKDNDKINELLVSFISRYMEIGEENPNILSSKSTNELFPKFKDKIKIIVNSKYSDYTTPINI